MVVYSFGKMINGGFKSALRILLTVCNGTILNTYLSGFDIPDTMPNFQRH